MFILSGYFIIQDIFKWGNVNGVCSRLSKIVCY